MMLDFLGHNDAHDGILRAIESVLADPHAPHTPDLGGKANTSDLGRALAQAIAEVKVSEVNVSELKVSEVKK